MISGGISSTIFGILYGSVFGKENLINAIFIRPMDNINTMLVYGIVVGCIFILMAMLLNIVNGIKSKNFKKAVLDGNGIIGLILYAFVLILIGYYFIKKNMLI